MPRVTYGPVIQARAMYVLEILIRSANYELDIDCCPHLDCRWHDSEDDGPQLVVRTTVRALHQISQPPPQVGFLSQTHIRDSLHYLADFLNILDDCRVHPRGSDQWHFILHLWSTDTEVNLQQAKALWEQKRSQKRKRCSSSQSPHSTIPQLGKHPQQPPIGAASDKRGLKPGVPFQAPPKPVFFVERPEQHKRVKGYLLGDTNDQGTLVVSAIYGLGGIGKTVLASAIAHDLEVQSKFYEGVLWSTLGNEPDVLALLSQWIQALGDRSYKPTSESAASSHLRTLLYDKHMLLVVDDVWNPAHADLFRVGGSNCCVLITTREAIIPGSIRCDLDVMTAEQSLRLLTRSIQSNLSESEMEDAQTLATRVGYLPLALEVMAAQVVDYISWTELKEGLQQEIADLDLLDLQPLGLSGEDTAQRNLSLYASFRLSLKNLLPEELIRFAWLGVLPEDVTITETMTATLWNITPHQSRAFLRFLKSKALLMAGTRQLDQTLGYRLHDLMHDMAKHLLVSEPSPVVSRRLPGLGLTLSVAHNQFLDRYRCKLRDGLWHTVPSDGYIHAHLTWHLEKAGQVETIHQLLRETTESGRNGWYTACDELDMIGNFVTDVARAWSLAEAHFEELPTQSIGLQCRYTLIKASLNSLVDNFPPELIGILVSEGIWQSTQGLAYLQRVPRPRQQFEGLEKLLPHLPASLLPKVIQFARGIQDKTYRTMAIVELATRFPSFEDEAMQSAQSLSDYFYKARALGKLTRLRPELWPHVLSVIRNAREEDQVSLLCHLISEIPDSLLHDSLEIAQDIQDTYFRVIALGPILLRMPMQQSNMLPTLLKSVRTISGFYERTLALGALAPLHPSLWNEVLRVIQSIEDEQAKASILCSLAHEIPENLLPHVLDITHSIKLRYASIAVLGKLIIRMPDLWEETLTATQVIQDESQQIRTLGKFATQANSIWEIILEYVQDYQHNYERSIALSILIDKDIEYCREALEEARKINDVYSRSLAFNELALKTPELLLDEVITSIQLIQDSNRKIFLLDYLLPQMPKLQVLVLDSIRSVKFSFIQARYLCKFSNRIPDSLKSEAIAIAQSFDDEREKILALSAFTPKMSALEQEIKQKVEILDFSSNYQYHIFKPLILATLATNTEELWPDVYKSICEINDERSKSRALDELASQFPKMYIDNALEICFSIQVDLYRAAALEKLLPYANLRSFTYFEWCRFLRTLAFLKRSILLRSMPTLGEIIRNLAGDEALLEVAYAIRDVGQQWK